MRIASRDRIWLLGGAVVALLLTFLTWQLLIKSQSDSDRLGEDRRRLRAESGTRPRRTSSISCAADSGEPRRISGCACCGSGTRYPPTTECPPSCASSITRARRAASRSSGLTVGSRRPVAGVAVGAPVQEINLNIVTGRVRSTTSPRSSSNCSREPRAVLITSLIASPASGGHSRSA